MTYKKLSFAACALLFSYAASAQISNQPFSFKNTGGGAGIGTAGREAIINEKLYGIRPENLLRAPGGELLYVHKGAGGSAFVYYPGIEQYIPQYRGTSFREYQPEMAAGIFNGFFLPTLYRSGAGLYPASSGNTVSTWTARVTSGGMPVSYMGGNVVDGWTGQVLMMDAP